MTLHGILRESASAITSQILLWFLFAVGDNSTSVTTLGEKIDLYRLHWNCFALSSCVKVATLSRCRGQGSTSFNLNAMNNSTTIVMKQNILPIDKQIYLWCSIGIFIIIIVATIIYYYCCYNQIRIHHPSWCILIWSTMGDGECNGHSMTIPCHLHSSYTTTSDPRSPYQWCGCENNFVSLALLFLSYTVCHHERSSWTMKLPQADIRIVHFDRNVYEPAEVNSKCTRSVLHQIHSRRTWSIEIEIAAPWLVQSAQYRL